MYPKQSSQSSSAICCEWYRCVVVARYVMLSACNVKYESTNRTALLNSSEMMCCIACYLHASGFLPLLLSFSCRPALSVRQAKGQRTATRVCTELCTDTEYRKI